MARRPDDAERDALIDRRIWRDADGIETPYSDLTDRHLLNILKHMRRRAIFLLADAAVSILWMDGIVKSDNLSDIAGDVLEPDEAEAEMLRKNNQEVDLRKIRVARWRAGAGRAFEPLLDEARRRKLDVSFLDEDPKAEQEAAEAALLRQWLKSKKGA